MECQASSCDGDTKVIDTTSKAEAVRRRRECKSCGDRFTTRERKIRTRQRFRTRHPY